MGGWANTCAGGFPRASGPWIATTRFELSFARTPRFWLVTVEAAPSNKEGELPLAQGQTFFLEWKGEQREWVRRPRFPDDVERLGGFSTIPAPEPPKPPTPPDRRDPPVQPLKQKRATPSSAITSSQCGARQEQQLGPPPRQLQSRQLPTDPGGTRPTRASVKALPKSKPPPPPKPSSGSESKTSWPSEHPQEDDGQHQQQPPDSTSFMQRTTGGGKSPSKPSPTPSQPTNEELEQNMEDPTWRPPRPPQTMAEILQTVTKVLHQLLQKSFTQPSEAVTTLAYRACYYVHQLDVVARSYMEQCQRAHNLGIAAPDFDPVAFELAISTPILDADDALQHLLQQHGELPRRILNKELAHIEDLLKQSKVTLSSWAKEPEAPGVHEAIACIKNGLDALDWAHLAIEEGSILQTGETLHIALQALRRSRHHVDEFLQWARKTMQLQNVEPPPKRSRTTERPPGSNHVPNFAPMAGDNPAMAPGKPEMLPQRRDDSAVPDRGDRGLPVREPEASPYSVLKAQEILRRLLPFAEHEMAANLAEAHAHLAQWTQALWGHPIQLLEDREDISQT